MTMDAAEIQRRVQAAARVLAGRGALMPVGLCALGGVRCFAVQPGRWFLCFVFQGAGRNDAVVTRALGDLDVDALRAYPDTAQFWVIQAVSKVAREAGPKGRKLASVN